MKYSLQWIIKHKGTFDFEEEITFPCEMFEKYAHINGLKDVIVSGTGNLDTRDKRLYVDLNIKGTMILPCALTLEDVDYPFDIDSTEVFSFEKPDPLEDVHEAKKDVVDFTPVVFSNIMLEVPTGSPRRRISQRAGAPGRAGGRPPPTRPPRSGTRRGRCRHTARS